MTHIFNGKEFAEEKLVSLKVKVEKLFNKGVKLTLASTIVGNDPASVLYVGIKKKVGERVGAMVDIISLQKNIKTEKLKKIIEDLNSNKNVHGIMIQLPLPEIFSENDKEDIINSISPLKDVDGLRIDSPFIHPTSKAILDVLDYAFSLSGDPLKTRSLKVCVVGSTGMVGGPLVKELKRRNEEPNGNKYELWEADSKTENLSEITLNADILISCCGVPGIIKKDMIKENAILIDVGAPIGDIEKNAYEKASFVSPVPGGIGPITVACLMENLTIASEKIINTTSL